MKDNVSVFVEPGTILDHRGVNGNLFASTGTLTGTEFNTAANLQRGDDVIETTVAHGILSVGGIYPAAPLDPNELWRIRGQRNALSSDAGDWRCGNGTAGLNSTNFVEWMLVVEVLSTTSFRVAVPLEFPDYLINDSSDPDPDARTRTTVQKVAPLRDAHWYGGIILADDETNATTLATSSLAVGCSVNDLIIRRGSANGRSVGFALSFGCEYRNVAIERGPVKDWSHSPDHASRNDFVVTSSQDCGLVGCSTRYAAQPVDLTYSGSGGVNVRPYVTDCTFDGCYEAATTHPGVYQAEWLRNKFLNCAYGAILERGLQATIHGNTCTSTTELGNAVRPGEDSVAIEINDGHAKGVDVQFNKITGFRDAVRIDDTGDDAEQCFTNVDAYILNNIIGDCYTGLATSFSATIKYAGLRNIHYRNNSHRRMQRSLVRLEGYSAGVDVIGNTLDGVFLNVAVNTSVSLVRAANGNCPGLLIDKNVWKRPPGSVAEAATVTLVSLEDVSDVATFPVLTWARKTRIRHNVVPFTDGMTGLVAAVSSTMDQIAPWSDGNLDGVRLQMQGATGPVGTSPLSTSATEYLTAQGILAPQATETDARQAIISQTIRLKRFYVILSTAPGVGQSRTFTVRRNGVDTLATVTISGAATNGTFAGDVEILSGGYPTISSTLTGTPAAAKAMYSFDYVLP